jgi:DNA-directed RNA polymerase specialized sigma subunit
MITKKNLGEYRDLRKEIERLEKRIDELEKMKCAPPDGFVKSSPTNKISDSTGTTAVINIEIEALKESLIERKFLYIRKAERIENAIYSKKLSSIERRILETYYIEGETWEKVAEIINYSLPHIFRLHGKALIKILEFSKDDSK